MEQVPNKQVQQEIDYVKILKIVFSRWYWVASTIIIALLIGYVYLWYTPDKYSTSASLKFEEKRSEISELLNVRNIYDRTNKMQSEQFVIRSRPVLINAISNIDYKISFFLKGRVRTTDIYPQKPLKIDIIEQDSLGFTRSLFDYEAISPDKFTLTYTYNNKEINKTYSINQIISVPGIKFKITNSTYNEKSNSVYQFKFNSKNDFLGRINWGLNMSETKGTNILSLSQTDINPFFATDILNAVLKAYVDYDRNQKTISATQTIRFIDTLQYNMSKVVKSSGTDLEQYKINNKMLDISTTSADVMNKLTKLETDKSTLALEGIFIAQLEKEIVNNRNANIINNNLQGITDPMLEGLLQQYNTLLQKKEEALLTYKPSSDFVSQLDKQILEVKSAFVTNARNQRQKNDRSIAFLDQQIAGIKQTFNTIPKAERDLINLQSNFEINQKVYSYLSEKKLEAQISKAAVTSGATIVDFAQINTHAIEPVPQKIYINALIIGLIAGISLIFIVRMLNPYIYDKETIESLTNIPIIGVIRRYQDKIDEDNKQILSIKNPKSLFAESVRSVRTNLSFLAADKKNKVVCITSEISGEGKSFTTVNLASTLCLIDKKVIIIAADLRKSKLHHTFKVDNLKGLSSYLSNQTELSNVLFKTEIEGLSFIPAGPVPPNPSELLYSDKMKDLLAQLTQEYDFVFIDSAPVGLVSDAVPLIRMADINLFVIRSGVSRYHSASVPERLSKEFNLSNIAIILNAFDNDILHSRYYTTNYSGSYYANYYYYSDYSLKSGKNGYYSDESHKKWWEFWKK
ncbi:GumC family protein [Pedobacter montanisoli]|uniref:non-specific protein-tyrosine kinase n=1 Tax=Pedobacter montanisoli TaxID=2923277 RepID=A0ABS9ZVX6_9SPHI|nr:tyrosine-protein kinase [Pedobacter montanisoli]MCJ0742456.1 polysaccharide biosynthesis tyrosine autokinase [Pedobacter montanisoli]